MKVLLGGGSPHKQNCTHMALDTAAGSAFCASRLLQ